MRGILIIAIFTAAIIASWIAFGIFHNVTTSTIAPDLQIKIDPIPATFDTETIESLRRRSVVDANLNESMQVISNQKNARPILAAEEEELTQTQNEQDQQATTSGAIQSPLL